MNDDSVLLRQFASEHSDAAFEALVRRHFDLVFSAARRQFNGDEHRAKDAAQRVFLDLARKAPALSRHPALSGWLYTATVYTARKMVRDEMRRSERERAMAEMIAPPAPITEASWDQVRPILDAEMLALKERDRTAIVLRYFEKRSFVEVGERLRLSENAARMVVERGLTKLKARLERRGVRSSAAALGVLMGEQAVVASPAGLAPAVAASVTAHAALGSSAGLALLLMSNKLAYGLAACGLLAAGTGAYFAQRAADQHRAVAAIDRECVQLEKGLDGWSTGPARAAGTAATKAASPRSRAVVAGPATDSSDEEKKLLYSEIAENPALRHQLGLNLIASYRLEYSELARKLGWSDAQLSDIVKRQVVMLSDLYDVQQAARLEGKDPDTDPSVQAMTQRIQAQRDQDIAQQVGPDGLQQLAALDREYPARQLAEQVAAQSAFDGDPVSSAQVEHLSQLIAAGSASYRAGAAVAAQDIDWNAVIAQNADSLPAGQVAMLRALQAQSAVRELKAQAKSAEGGEQ